MSGTPCHEKIPFPSILAVLDEAVVRVGKRHSTATRPYKCPICNNWHFTSSGRRWNPPQPFPIPRWYYSIQVDGRKVWQSQNLKRARKVLKDIPGGEIYLVQGRFIRERIPTHGLKRLTTARRHARRGRV